MVRSMRLKFQERSLLCQCRPDKDNCHRRTSHAPYRGPSKSPHRKCSVTHTNFSRSPCSSRKTRAVLITFLRLRIEDTRRDCRAADPTFCGFCPARRSFVLNRHAFFLRLPAYVLMLQEPLLNRIEQSRRQITSSCRFHSLDNRARWFLLFARRHCENNYRRHNHPDNSSHGGLF